MKNAKNHNRWQPKRKRSKESRLDLVIQLINNKFNYQSQQLLSLTSNSYLKFNCLYYLRMVVQTIQNYQ